MAHCLKTKPDAKDVPALHAGMRGGLTRAARKYRGNSNICRRPTDTHLQSTAIKKEPVLSTHSITVHRVQLLLSLPTLFPPAGTLVKPT